jgi:alpha-mannosidase
VNLYNNQWSTNFPQWIGGSWTSRVRLWPVDKYDTEASLVIPGWEARVPLVAAFFEGPAGTLDVSRAVLELSRKGVVVTAFGANPEGPGVVMRLWEQAGRDGVLEVHLPEGHKVKSVQPCDLRGRPVENRIVVTNGRFQINLERYAPASFLLEEGK